MTEVHYWHRKIFQSLEGAGIQFSPRAHELTREHGPADFQCFCGRAFSTSVGLATHQRKQHNMFSIEHSLLTGATCPACLKHFWSTQRLQQHLAYISRRTGRNDCFQTLMRAGFQTEYECTPRPAHIQGLNRANWIQAQGPPARLPDLRVNQIAQCEAEIAALLQRQELPPLSVASIELCQRFVEHLTKVTLAWFEEFREAGFDIEGIPGLEQRWIDVLASTLEEASDSQIAVQIERGLEKSFLDWGHHQLGDLIAEFQDGDAEFIADEAFAMFAQEFQTTSDQQRVSFLRQRVQLLMDQHPDHPHRTLKEYVNTTQRYVNRHVTMRFEEQATWQEKLRTVRWDQCLPSQPIPRLLKR